MARSTFGRGVGRESFVGVAVMGGLLLAGGAARAAAATSSGDNTALEIPGSPQAGPIGASGHFLLAEGYMVVVPTGPAVLPAGGTAIEGHQSVATTFSLFAPFLP